MRILKKKTTLYESHSRPFQKVTRWPEVATGQDERMIREVILRYLDGQIAAAEKKSG